MGEIYQKLDLLYTHIEFSSWNKEPYGDPDFQRITFKSWNL